MKFRMVILLLLVIAFSMLFSVKRTIYTIISIERNGSASVVIKEILNSNDGGALFKDYYSNEEVMKKDKALRKEFFKDFSKEFYLLYGTAAMPDSYDEPEVNVSKSTFQRVWKFYVEGMIKQVDKEAFSIERKNFQIKDQTDEKRLLPFFERFFDSRFLQSAYAENFDKRGEFVTHKITEIILPPNSKILDILPQKYSSGKYLKKWEVDLGHGNLLKGFTDVKRYKNTFKVVIDEVEVTRVQIPDEIKKGETEKLLSIVRDVGALNIIFSNREIKSSNLTKPHPFNPKEDFSKGWSYNLSFNVSHKFKDGPVTLTPGVDSGVNFKVNLKWEYKWRKIHCCYYRYQFNKFEGKITINPYVKPYVKLHAGSSKSKSWSKQLWSKEKWFTFWVSGVPVWIVLEVSVDAKASVGASASIDINTYARFDVYTSVTFKYQGRWSKSVSKSYHYSGVNFSANAKVNAYAKGELPVTFSGFIYDVSGPYVRLTPWIKGQADASAGTSSNQVGYKVTGGLKLTGGVDMAGWLKNICGKIGSIDYTIWSRTWTLKQGTLTF